MRHIRYVQTHLPLPPLAECVLRRFSGAGQWAGGNTPASHQIWSKQPPPREPKDDQHRFLCTSCGARKASQPLIWPRHVFSLRCPRSRGDAIAVHGLISANAPRGHCTHTSQSGGGPLITFQRVCFCSASGCTHWSPDCLCVFLCFAAFLTRANPWIF
jgi:hypothetical protein